MSWNGHSMLKVIAQNIYCDLLTWHSLGFTVTGAIVVGATVTGPIVVGATVTGDIVVGLTVGGSIVAGQTKFDVELTDWTKNIYL